MPAADPNAANPLLDDFVANGGRLIHKWIDYFEVYHRHLQRYRGRPVTMLEIGVQNGGSAHLWRRYLGEQAKIIGVDVDPACKALEAEGFEIWIGDQADPAFWQGFLKVHPALDIVLDDGGHTMVQQIQTFQSLFPALRDGGTYLCEDTHTSYFAAHGGGLGREGTFHEMVKILIDQMHAWYFAPLSQLGRAYIAKNLFSLAVYDSIVVMEKRRKNPPLALARGNNGLQPAPPAMTFIELRRHYGAADE